MSEELIINVDTKNFIIEVIKDETRNKERKNMKENKNKKKSQNSTFNLTK